MRLILDRAKIARNVLSALALALVVFVAGVAGSGCASSNPNSSVYQFPGEGAAVAPPSGSAVAAAPGVASPGSNPAPAPSNLPASALRVGDMLSVTFSDIPPPNGLAEVRSRIPEDGMLTLHYSVRVKAAGRTIPELEQDIRSAFVPKYFRNLTAIVRADERFFFVNGEVKTPGRYPLQGDMTVLRAIAVAGGFTDYAKRTKIELRRQDGSKIIVNEKKVRANKEVDPAVQANDSITVDRRLF